MDVNEKLRQIYAGQVNASRQNPTPSRTYHEELRQSEPDITSLGFGCADIFSFLDPSEIQQRRILDFGCGAGSDLALIAKKYQPSEALGVDICPEMVNEANALFKRQKLQNVQAIAGTLPDLKSDIKAFDFIISNAVIHLNPQKEKLFTELYRLCSESGVMLIADFATSKALPEELAGQYRNSGGLFLFGGLEPLEVYEQGLAKAGFEEIEKLKLFHFDPLPEVRSLLIQAAGRKKMECIYQKMKGILFHIVIYKIRKKAEWVKVDYLCPSCCTANTSLMLQSVNRQIHRNISAGLLHGNVNFPACTNCGLKHNPVSFQYHDMNNKTMAFIFPSTVSDQKEAILKSVYATYEKKLPPDYKLHCCFNLDEFLNTVR
jgi:ubiquinone/menaquinone biosynthesis C-methylase UbiE